MQCLWQKARSPKNPKPEPPEPEQIMVLQTQLLNLQFPEINEKTRRFVVQCIYTQCVRIYGREEYIPNPKNVYSSSKPRTPNPNPENRTPNPDDTPPWAGGRQVQRCLCGFFTIVNYRNILGFFTVCSNTFFWRYIDHTCFCLVYKFI